MKGTKRNVGSDHEIRTITYVGVEMSWTLPSCLSYLLNGREDPGFSWGKGIYLLVGNLAGKLAI